MSGARRIVVRIDSTLLVEKDGRLKSEKHEMIVASSSAITHL
jgi:hypothetical protein